MLALLVQRHPPHLLDSVSCMCSAHRQLLYFIILLKQLWMVALLCFVVFFFLNRAFAFVRHPNAFGCLYQTHRFLSLYCFVSTWQLLALLLFFFIYRASVFVRHFDAFGWVTQTWSIHSYCLLGLYVNDENENGRGDRNTDNYFLFFFFETLLRMQAFDLAWFFSAMIVMHLPWHALKCYLAHLAFKCGYEHSSFHFVFILLTMNSNSCL